MATKQISLFGSLNPNAAGDMFWRPAAITMTNKRFDLLVAHFQKTSPVSKVKGSGAFTIPKDYVNTPKIVVVWGTSAVSGNCVWDFDYKAIAAGENLDPTTDDQNATVTTAAAATAWLELRSTLNLTAANFAVDDLVQFSLGRDGADVADTISVDVLVWDILFEYSDS